MIPRGLLFLTTVYNCVLSLPVTSSHLENEDVKVMKCIVEALADVLSRPHPLPVSQECLVILRTEDRLVSILRHHNFLKELQDIAVLGERAQLQGDIIMASDHVTPAAPQSSEDMPDRSMLEALGGPGERSILTQRKRTGTAKEEEEDGATLDKESQERNEIDGKSPEKRGKDERPDNHISDPIKHWSEDGEEEKRDEEEEGEEEGEEEKRASTSVEENSNGHESSEKRDTPESKSEEKKSAEEVEGEEEEEKEEEKEGGEKVEEVEKKRSKLFSQEEEEEEEEAEREVKAEDGDGLKKKWTKRNRKPSVAVAAKKRGGQAEGAEAREERGGSQQEVLHHSKEEVMGGKEDRTEESRRSPEVKELQMMARRGGEEEEGSASRRSEEPEIESLAAIESELESVAQKLHELRRG